MYEQDIFYDAMKLSLKKRAALLRRAFKVKYDWWVDKLDCRESFCRQKIEMAFDEIMGRLTESVLVSVIHRRGFSDPQHMEVGFRTMEEPIDYFLWIQVPISMKDEIVKGLRF